MLGIDQAEVSYRCAQCDVGRHFVIMYLLPGPMNWCSVVVYLQEMTPDCDHQLPASLLCLFTPEEV